MSPTCPSNAIPLFWPREILPDQFSRVARAPIPCAVMTILGKAFDPLHMTAEVKSAAAQDLPHAVRRREAVSILPRVGARAQRNRCAPNDDLPRTIGRRSFASGSMRMIRRNSFRQNIVSTPKSTG